MTVEQKIKSLKAKRLNLLSQAKKETVRLEKEFKALQAANKRTLTEELKTWSGRYYAVVGPILKQAKEYQKAIEILK